VTTPSSKLDESYSRYFGDLVRLCRALGAGPEAEDLAQETLIYAREHIDELRDPNKVTPWLRQIARRSARRHLKHKPRSVGEPVLVFAPRDVAMSLDLAGAVARLPLRERQAIGLVYGLGYSQEEVAEVLGIARGTVAATLFHARRRLGDLLASSRENS